MNKTAQSSGIGPELPHVNEKVQAYLAQTRTPGMAIAVTQGYSIRWARGYGFADLEAQKLYTPDTIQYSGSVMKTFTTTVALQLWEHGLLDLDADIGQYLPYQVRNRYFPDTPITTRHILTHTSSLTESTEALSPYSLAYRSGDPGDRPGEFAQIWLAVDGIGYGKEAGFFTEHEPGTHFLYANVSWLLITDMVENLTGKSFRQWCKDEIFSVLGMHSSGFYLSDIDVKRHAALYSYMENGQSQSDFGFMPHLQLDRKLRPRDGYVRYALYQHPNFPDGGLRTTAHDLSLWLMTWLNGGSLNGRRILKEETVNAALSSQTSVPMTDAPYYAQGFGWRQDKKDGSAFPTANSWWHGGIDFGARNHVWLNRDTGVGAVVVSNFEAEPHSTIFWKFFVKIVADIVKEL